MVGTCPANGFACRRSKAKSLIASSAKTSHPMMVKLCVRVILEPSIEAFCILGAAIPQQTRRVSLPGLRSAPPVYYMLSRDDVSMLVDKKPCSENRLVYPDLNYTRPDLLDVSGRSISYLHRHRRNKLAPSQPNRVRAHGRTRSWASHMRIARESGQELHASRESRCGPERGFDHPAASNTAAVSVS